MLQTTTKLYADVILPLSLQNTYTYTIPEEMKPHIKEGIRVVVQFGKKKLYTAIVYKIHNNKPENYETKPIEMVLDSHICVNSMQIMLWEWIADYYMCTMGEVYNASLPAGLKPESETKITCNTSYSKELLTDEHEKNLYEALLVMKSANIGELSVEGASKKKTIQIIQNLIEKGAFIIDEELKRTFKDKTEPITHCLGDITDKDYFNSVFELLHKAPKQLELFLMYSKMLQECTKRKAPPIIKKKDLLARCNSTSATYKSLEDKNIFRTEMMKVSRLEIDDTINLSACNPLNEHQQTAYNQIVEHFKTFTTVLLHGVTSSGKTEIYIQLILKTLQEGKQVLYLLPEIALTSQIVKRLQSVFGRKVGVYHSKYSDSERVEVYNNLRDYGKTVYSIILGVRSAIFLPFTNLGLIIVDEEHESTFKQYDPAPRYNARDCSIVLARFHEAKVLLGSATPSIESYYNASTGKYALVELMVRYKNIELPQVITIDLKEARKKKRLTHNFSKDLLQEIDLALKNNNQVILFKNRRGFIPYIECTQCGLPIKCKYCDISLTYHKYTNSLMCHYCGYVLPYSTQCKACGNTN
ncbi:MAG: primosomal protein N', partial [Bacteroidales bacterium]